MVDGIAFRHSPFSGGVAEADGSGQIPTLIGGHPENLIGLSRAEELQQGVRQLPTPSPRAANMALQTAG